MGCSRGAPPSGGRSLILSLERVDNVLEEIRVARERTDCAKEFTAGSGRTISGDIFARCIDTVYTPSDRAIGIPP